MARSRSIQVDIIYGIRDQLKDYEQQRVERLDKVNLHFHPRLHAKAYLNETEAIVTSLNLSDAAEDNRNHEFGIFFTKAEHPKMYEALRQECEAILHEIRTMSFEEILLAFVLGARGLKSLTLTGRYAFTVIKFGIFGRFNLILKALSSMILNIALMKMFVGCHRRTAKGWDIQHKNPKAYWKELLPLVPMMVTSS